MFQSQVAPVKPTFNIKVQIFEVEFCGKVIDNILPVVFGTFNDLSLEKLCLSDWAAE